MFGEERTRTLLKPIDPARHSTFAPPRLSAHDLISRAEAVAEPVARRRQARPTRRLVLAAGTLVVAVGAAATVQAFGPSSSDTPEVADPPGAASGMVLVPVAYGSDTRDAARELRALANRLVDAEYDNRTGRWMYHRTKTWGDPMLTSPDGRHRLGFAQDTELWGTADEAARSVRLSFVPDYPDQESREYWQHQDSLDYRRRDPKARDAWFAAKVAAFEKVKQDPVRLDVVPLPSGRAQLNELLKVRSGAAAVSEEVGMVYGQYVVPRQTRAEILRVLADVPGFRWRGQVTDRAGRKGVAITFDDRKHNAQFLLIFDPNTGELLAHERLTLSPLRVDAYEVIFDTAWADKPPADLSIHKRPLPPGGGGRN